MHDNYAMTTRVGASINQGVAGVYVRNVARIEVFMAPQIQNTSQIFLTTISSINCMRMTHLNSRETNISAK